jgi:hypothetical protein
MNFYEVKPGVFVELDSIESVNTNDNSIITKSGNLHTITPETCAEMRNIIVPKKKTEKPKETEK